jgi:NDP-sugar pyrophosphorylase family protein
MVAEYLRANSCFGMRIEISREDVLLDTGGGLNKAGWFFLEDANENSEPFILHNVDVISNIDLGRMVRFHREHQAIATLAVQKRQTSRYLLFNEASELCGRNAAQGQMEIVRQSKQTEELAFSGIHVISPAFLRMMSENGVFSIIDSYLRAAAEGKRIVAFRADDYHWRDLGTPQSLKQAEEDLQKPA